VKTLNLYQCAEQAKEIGYDKAQFVAVFPVGPVNCQWLDAYMGLFKILYKDLDKGFVTISEIDKAYPDLVCSEPWIKGEE
jgi:hypothetical protein